MEPDLGAKRQGLVESAAVVVVEDKTVLAVQAVAQRSTPVLMVRMAAPEATQVETQEPTQAAEAAGQPFIALRAYELETAAQDLLPLDILLEL